MTHILTLVASTSPLLDSHLEHAALFLGTENTPGWLAPGKAADLTLHARPGRKQIEALWTMLADDRIDVFVTEAANRRKKLLLADMDATIVTTETLDELAGYAGLHDRVAAITAKAMRGDLDFRAALKERVGMLHGLPQKTLQETLDKTGPARDAARVFVFI